MMRYESAPHYSRLHSCKSFSGISQWKEHFIENSNDYETVHQWQSLPGLVHQKFIILHFKAWPSFESSEVGAMTSTTTNNSTDLNNHA